MHEVLFNYLFKLAQEKRVLRGTDRPTMSIAVNMCSWITLTSSVMLLGLACVHGLH